MKKILTLCGMAIGLAGCMSDDGMSMEEEIALAFPDPNDRQGVFMASPRGDQSPPKAFRIGIYSDEVSDQEIADRLEAYCANNGYGPVVIGDIRDGWQIVKEDGSQNNSRGGMFACG